MSDLEKLAMVEKALADLVEAVGSEPLARVSRNTVDAFQRAQGALDALAFVNKLGAKS